MTRRALVVDDDQSMVRTLSDVLRLKGWDVATAYSGDAAVALTREQDFDVVLMDIRMPGMDGVEAFRAMKAARPDVRVVLMTAYSAQDRILEAEREGVIRIFPKPLDVGALLSLLAAMLNHRQPVLIVDHDAAFLRTLSQVLEMRGYDVVAADSLDHAKQLMAERRPLAVLLHMHMDSEPAREAVTAVHESGPSVALILYSGRPDAAEELQQALPTEWIHAYLQKPFAVEQVTGVLDAIRRAS